MKINGNPDGGGGSAVIEGLSITSNGTYTAGAGVDGYSPVEVDVQPELQNKTVVENGEYIADQGYYGLGTVTVSVPSPQFVTESLSVSVNGTYAPGQGVDGYSQVVVDVPQSVTGFTEKDITEGVQIVNLNNSASSVHPYVFYKNTYLQTVNLPNCIVVNEQAFNNCSNLITVNLPICTTVSNYAFSQCYNLVQVSLPLCESIASSAFINCIGLSSLNLPVCSYIGDKAFANYRRSFYLTLGYSSVVTIYGNTFATATVYAYVPSSLVDTYKSAQYWSAFSDRIFPIPEP